MKEWYKLVVGDGEKIMMFFSYIISACSFSAVSPTTIAVAVIVSLCVAAFIITSFLYLFCTRWDALILTVTCVMMSSVNFVKRWYEKGFYKILFVPFVSRLKESWWDSVGDYKNSTLLFMVPGDHKVHSIMEFCKHRPLLSLVRGTFSVFCKLPPHH